jgi:hypothetical protein
VKSFKHVASAKVEANAIDISITQKGWVKMKKVEIYIRKIKSLVKQAFTRLLGFLLKGIIFRTTR